MTDPADLERLLDRELRRLPAPRAPETLLPRVMSAARQSLVPWYRRPWVTWPVPVQAASVAPLLALLAGISLVFPWIQRASAAGASRLAEAVPQTLVDAVRWASEGAAIMNIVSQVLLQPVAVYVFALAIALSVACGALWSALNRLALGGASHQ